MILTAVIFLCPQHNLHDTDAVSVGLWWYMYIQCTTWGRSYHNFFSQYWQFSNCVSSESLLSLTPQRTTHVKLQREQKPIIPGHLINKNDNELYLLYGQKHFIFLSCFVLTLKTTTKNTTKYTIYKFMETY